MIEVRRDTLTRPTNEMRRVMAGAEVGDDVYGEDPSVLELERRTAETLGKEAAVFKPTGVNVAVRKERRPAPGRASGRSRRSNRHHREGDGVRL